MCLCVCSSCKSDGNKTTDNGEKREREIEGEEGEAERGHMPCGVAEICIRDELRELTAEVPHLHAEVAPHNNTIGLAAVAGRRLDCGCGMSRQTQCQIDR